MRKKNQKPSFFQRLKKFFWKTFLWFNVISIAIVLLYKFVPVPLTPLMIIRTIEQKVDGKEMTCSHDWVSIEDISQNLQKAVIASEDGNFFKHNGFDFKAIEKAIENNEKGKRIKGGSTISQQTAKNVLLWPGRSFIRKGFEAYYTVLIELFWSKKRILEVYLNSIEMGNGIYGSDAATKYWYKKSAKSLTKNEAAGIAVILPNPRKYKATGNTSYINKRKAKISKYIDSVKLEY